MSAININKNNFQNEIMWNVLFHSFDTLFWIKDSIKEISIYNECIEMLIPSIPKKSNQNIKQNIPKQFW